MPRLLSCMFRIYFLFKLSAQDSCQKIYEFQDCQYTCTKEQPNLTSNVTWNKAIRKNAFNCNEFISYEVDN